MELSNNKNSTGAENIISNTHPSLPKGWVWVRLGDICYTATGGTPSRKVSLFYCGNIPWLKSGELNDSIIYDSEEKITEIALNSSSAKIFPKGTLLIALYGATVGKLGILGIDAATNQAICGIYINQKILIQKYLFYFLHSYRKNLLEKRFGGAQPNISQATVKNIILPLPSLAEQHRIVAKIEELFTKLDAGVEALKKAKEQIKRYRQAVLKYAFEGKLTEEWRKSFELSILNDELKQTQNPQLNTQHSTFKTENSTFNTQHSKFTTQNYEPASVLLERIKEERKKKLGKKHKELPPVYTSELPELPKGWVWTRIGDVTEVTPEDNFSNLDPSLPTTFVPMSAIDENTGTIKNPETLPLKDARKGHTHFRENDILFARITPCMENGKSAVATKLINGIGFGSTEFIVIRPPRDILPKFIFHFIRQETFRFKAKAHFKSTVGQLRVPKGFVINAEIPLPPLLEQHRIVEEIERRFSVADEVEKTIDQCLKQAERLRQSILKKAFEGKLVPQDPNDEPAEKLLERIKNV